MSRRLPMASTTLSSRRSSQAHLGSWEGSRSAAGSELAQGRGESERQPARPQVNEVDQGAAAMRRLDREAQANYGVGLLRKTRHPRV
jgi:hypothetical protein